VANSSQPIHDSPTVLLATLFAARRSGDVILERLMRRRLVALGIHIRFATARPRRLGVPRG
jgi:hypothetical protein